MSKSFYVAAISADALIIDPLTNNADVIAFRDWRELDLTNAGWCSCGTPDPMDHIESCTVNLPQDIIKEIEDLLA